MPRSAWSLAAALVALLAHAAPGARAAEPSARPHLVVILADDLGAGDVGWKGSAIRTPRLDRLAAEGVTLDAFYATQECTPTRAALLTGRYPLRYGLQDGVFWPWNRVGLSLDERLLPQALREAGYATQMVGKWHLGIHEPAYLPMARGFDGHYGPYLGIIDHFAHQYYQGLDWHRDGKPVREEGWATTLMGREAARRIRAHDFAAKPLFLYFAPTAPHSPLQAPPEHAQSYADMTAPARRTYAQMMAGLDDAVGMVIDALEEKGVMDRTLVVFASDNGASLELGGSNGSLRGGKSELWEGGVRVPAFATWRGVLPAGGRVAVPLHVVDLYPTLLRLAGAPLEQPLPIDGVDAWPALARGEALARSEILLGVTARQSALRAGDWKLVRTNDPGAFKVELFDVAKDPGEKRDLARRFPDRLDALEQRLAAWQAQAARPLGPFPMVLPAGYRVPEVWGDPGAKAPPR